MSSDLLWPDSLPCFRFEPYSVAPRPGALQLDLNIHSHRVRIYTQNNEVFSVEMILKLAEEQTLLDFYKDDTAYGSQSFLVSVWVDSEFQTWECMFIGEPPNSVPVAQSYIRTQFRMLGRPVDLSPCPLLGSPVGTVDNVEVVTLDWSAVIGATSYQVFLWEDGDVEPLTPTYTTTDTEQAVTGLEAETTYHWRVTPVGAAGPTEGCGEATFTTSLPACPELQIPVEGSAVGEETSTTLLWNSVPEAVSYRVYVWEDGDPMPGSPTTTTSDLTYEVTGLTINTDYRWVVLAVTDGGFVSAGCGEGTFSTEASEPTIQWQSASFTGDILGPSVTLTAVRSGSTAGTASADYDFTEGTALAAVDYVATPGTVTFDPGEVTKDVVVTLVRDYNAEVLANNPTAFWPFSEASGTTFADLSPNGLDLTLTSTSGILYQQADLNLSADKSLSKTGTNSWRLYVNVNSLFPAHTATPFTARGWVRHFNQAPGNIKSLFQIGGPGGGGQFYFCWCYRAATTGLVAMSWHHNSPSTGNTFITKTFTQVLPLDDPYWFEAGFDSVNNRCFFKFNDQAVEYVSYNGITETPNGLDSTSGRQTSFYVGQRPVGNAGDMIDGKFSDFEFLVDAVSTVGRYPRWNLDASLDFTATLSNPTGATLGAIDVATMTIEAP